MGLVATTGAGSPLALEWSANLVRVLLNGARTEQTGSFQTAGATGDGPLPGSTFNCAETPTAAMAVDLVGMLGPPAYCSSGFDLSGFSCPLVLLTSPMLLQPVCIGPIPKPDSILDPVFTDALPADLQLSIFNDISEIQVAFDGVQGVAVHAVDFMSNDHYLRAKSWLMPTSVKATARPSSAGTALRWR